MKTKCLLIWDNREICTESNTLKKLLYRTRDTLLNYIEMNIKKKIDILEFEAGQTKGQNTIKEVTALVNIGLFSALMQK